MEKKNKKETPGRKLIEREGEKNRGERENTDNLHLLKRKEKKSRTQAVMWLSGRMETISDGEKRTQMQNPYEWKT